MIELIQDGREHEVLIYTNDATTAVKLRKVFAMDGAVYSGKPAGYSWRMAKRPAVLHLKRLGLRFDHIRTDEK
jgi:hypothetical protein